MYIYIYVYIYICIYVYIYIYIVGVPTGLDQCETPDVTHTRDNILTYTLPYT